MSDESSATPRDFPRRRANLSCLDSHRLSSHGPRLRPRPLWNFLGGSSTFNAGQSSVPVIWPLALVWYRADFSWCVSSVCYRLSVTGRLLQQASAARSLGSGTPRRWPSPSLWVLAVLGVAMAVYLISVRPIAQNSSSKSQGEFHGTDSRERHSSHCSNHSVEETVSRLQSILQAKGVKLFTIVDHSGEAASAGLKMPKHQAAHLRQSQGRHTSDARFAQLRSRPPAQKSSLPKTPPERSGSPTTRLPTSRHATISRPSCFPISR